MTGCEGGVGGGDLQKALMDGLQNEVVTPKVGKFWTAFWTLLLFWGVLAIGVDLAMLGPTLEELAAQLELSVASTGSLFTWRAAGYFVGSVWCGDLMHRYKNIGLLFSVPLATCAAGVLLLPMVSSYPVACMVFLSQGVPMGMLDTGGNVAMLSLWRGSGYQNGFVHAFHFFFGIGSTVAPLLVRSVLAAGLDPVISWQYAGEALLLTFLGLLAAGIFGPQVLSDEDDDEKEESTALGSTVATMTGVFLFIYVGLEVSFGGYLDVFSVRQWEQTKTNGAALTSVYWGALSVGRLVATAVTSFVHHARYLALHLLLTVASMVGLLLVSFHSKDEGGEEWAEVLGVPAVFLAPVAAVGFALGPLFPGAILVAEELLGRALPPKLAGFMVGSAAAGEMSLPLLVGVLFSYSEMLFCWSQLVLAAGACIVFFLNSKSVLRA